MTTPARKLNFGCGTRFAPGWTNIDVYSAGPEVRRVNLLRPFPFPDAHFDAVYSSHVLEHFTPAEADHLVAEAFRVLKPGGILRTVVPDLEASCREYLRALDASPAAGAPDRAYRWAVLELLDQMTRSTPSGEMRGYFAELRASGDAALLAHVEARAGKVVHAAGGGGLAAKLRALTPQKVRNKLFYVYLNLVSRLFPRHIRSQVMVLTGLGERHRWMYDRVGLRLLLERHGFSGAAVKAFNESDIPGFNADGLDIEPDGTPYKAVSLYLEARRPGS